MDLSLLVEKRMATAEKMPAPFDGFSFLRRVSMVSDMEVVSLLQVNGGTTSNTFMYPDRLKEALSQESPEKIKYPSDFTAFMYLKGAVSIHITPDDMGRIMQSGNRARVSPEVMIPPLKKISDGSPYANISLLTEMLRLAFVFRSMCEACGSDIAAIDPRYVEAGVRQHEDSAVFRAIKDCFAMARQQRR